jgi:hypothetical protein
MTFALAFFTGCEKDEKDGRDVYLGQYRITNERVGTETTDIDYNITITKSSANDEDVLISNVLNLGAGYSLIATIRGDSFTVPFQTIQSVGFVGSGRRNGNSLSFNMQVTLTGIGTVNWIFDCVKM